MTRHPFCDKHLARGFCGTVDGAVFRLQGTRIRTLRTFPEVISCTGRHSPIPTRTPTGAGLPPRPFIKKLARSPLHSAVLLSVYYVKWPCMYRYMVRPQNAPFFLWAPQKPPVFRIYLSKYTDCNKFLACRLQAVLALLRSAAQEVLDRTPFIL